MEFVFLVGIARTGSIIGHTSGDFVFTFSTKNKRDHYSSETINQEAYFNDNNLLISSIYRMTIDAVQESIYNAILSAKNMIGRDFNTCVALTNWLLSVNKPSE